MSTCDCFTVAQNQDVVIVHLAGPRVPDEDNSFRAALLDLIQEQSIKKLVVTFNQVRRCTSCVMSALIVAQRRLKTAGGKLKLCCMTEPVRDKFRKLKLEPNVFEIEDTLAEALAAFAPASSGRLEVNSS